ncbi:chemotaxis response regulator protein-glutamate methylesterase [Paenibacillus sp. GCM10027626]|uniref:protein-glutamate methylesterase/protein-glutamine glutaminase n=1 Tax=Paenibacillus sp. GCM10027626 TaxID=3273411 RepID=UPI003629CE4B
MASYRVLIVDDSAFMRKIFSDLIAADSQFEIVATATNGHEAIEAAEQWRPDIITLDLEMPEMNGLEALGHIMKKRPTPIIMMSSTTDDGTRETIKALQYGAFDFIRKPSGVNSPDIYKVGELLLEKMRAAVAARKSRAAAAELRSKTAAQLPSKISKAQAIPKKETPQTGLAKQEKPKQFRAFRSVPAVSAESEPQTAFNEQEQIAASESKPELSSHFRHIVVIGTSTGGPRALHEVISSLPGDFSAPVLVVQHMPPKFTHSLAVRLNSFSKLHVAEAVQGEQVLAGKVYVAPGGWHMTLKKEGAAYYIKLTQDAPRGGHRPSVDVLFESCIPYAELERHAVIMTGMGSDGAKGMKALKESGARSAIAEAEQSCIVYGMPRSALETGAADVAIPLKQIAGALAAAVRK